MCTPAVILQCLFLSCTCLCNNNKWCLPSFVSPSPCTVLLLQYFLLNKTACIYINRWSYFWAFATTSFKKRGGFIFEDGPIFEIRVQDWSSTAILSSFQLDIFTWDFLVLCSKDQQYRPIIFGIKDAQRIHYFYVLIVIHAAIWMVLVYYRWWQ